MRIALCSIPSAGKLPTIMVNKEITSKRASSVIKGLRKYHGLRREDRVKILIDSPGGSFDAALSIREVISDAPFRTIGVVTGRSNSAATLILEACTFRVMEAGTTISIHDVQGWTRSREWATLPGTGQFNRVAINEAMDQIEEGVVKRREQLRDIIQERTELSREVVEMLIAENQDLSPEESLRYRLIDFIQEVSAR